MSSTTAVTIAPGAGSGTTTTNDNSNNNSNNNSVDPEYPFLESIQGISPTLPHTSYGYDYNGINHDYRVLNSFINKKESLTIDELNDFLKQYCVCLLKSEGYKSPKWFDPMLSHVNGDTCSYLGNIAHGNKGCKISELPEKLKAYIIYMSKMLLYVFKYKITEDLRNKIITDTDTINYLEYVLQDLFYFYGQKQIKPPFAGEAAPIFNNLVDSMNSLFKGYKIIRVTCPKSDYGCGRYIGARKCANSNNRYIYIHRTGGASGKSESNNTKHHNTNSVMNKESSSCGGGARKTRRSKQRTKKRKTRMNH